MEKFEVEKFNRGGALINLYINGLVIGFIEFNVYPKEYFISSDFSETEYFDTFSNDKLVMLDTLYIDKQFRNKGYGNKLMNKFCQIKGKLFQNQEIILNACPTEFNIPLNALIGFYSKYGFEKFKLSETENSCLMIFN